MSRNRRHVTEKIGGSVSSIECNVEDDDPRYDTILAKTLFELSRVGDDPTVGFDAAVHTFAALAAGIEHHRMVTCLEIDVAEIPTDRSQRGDWRLRDGQLRLEREL